MYMYIKTDKTDRTVDRNHNRNLTKEMKFVMYYL